MIEAKATADDKRDGCEVIITMNGSGHQLVEETLALIQGVMGSIKEKDVLLHLLIIRAIAEHSEILRGDDEESDKAQEFERLVATAKIREGVN